MAAALRAAEGGGYIFSKSSGGGYYQNFSGQGGYTPPTPPIPDPCLKQTLKGTVTCGQCKQELGAFDWHNNGFNCLCEAHKGLNYYIDIQIEANKVTK